MQRLPDHWSLGMADAPVLELPTDRPRSAARCSRVRSLRFTLPGDLAAGCRGLAGREGVTLFVLMLAAFKVLLKRYTGQDDVVVGTPGHGRRAAEGTFPAGALALRSDLAHDPPFRELLARVRAVVLEARARREPPAPGAPRPFSAPGTPHPPLPVWFELAGQQPPPLPRLSGAAGELPFDLSLRLEETGHGLRGAATYAAELFDPSTITRLIGHYQTLLQGVLADPTARLSQLPLLSQAEERQLLQEWNAPQAPPGDLPLHRLFEQQAARSPGAVALVWQQRSLTYAELNGGANRLAHHLRGMGIGAGSLVALCARRSPEMVLGLLAILKAGAAYLPLDPLYPAERLSFMLGDSAPAALLSQGNCRSLFTALPATLPVLELSAPSPPWAGQPATDPDPAALGLRPGHMANVLYTSGSTGTPKGVAASHRGLQNLVPWYIRECDLGCDDAVLLVTSHSYDLTQRNIFAPLCAGARLVLAPDPFDPAAIAALIARERVTVMNLTPTAFYALAAAATRGELGGVRLVVFGGEPLHAARLTELPEPRPAFINGYGPTECTGIIAFHRLSPDLERYRLGVPIGKPVPNARIYILDPHRQPVPVGVTGEIYIGGVPVGLGYLNRPELSAERFLPDPFLPGGGARMYRTGDLARWCADGTVIYLGRNDFQVKIRGFRVEPGEVEARLAEFPGVRDAVVLAHDSPGKEQRLVAYLVPRDGLAPEPARVRDFLRQRLPEFMVPAAFVILEAFPVTPNGKVDRKALPEPERNRADGAPPPIAPRSPEEEQLLRLWSEALGVEGVGIRDNFFALGGDSLSAAQVVSQINSRFAAELPMGIIYQHPTVAELAAALASPLPGGSRYSLVPINTGGARPPLFAIHTISLLDLPRYLGRDQPLYFLRYGMAAEPGAQPSRLPGLEELARHYLAEIKLVQPHGPYHLLGFSFGGVVAYQMARQLAASGEEVAFLGLLDSTLKGGRTWLPWKSVIANLLRLPPLGLCRLIKEKIGFLSDPCRHDSTYYPQRYTPGADRACRQGYTPSGDYRGPVTFFEAAGGEELLFRREPAGRAWRELLGDRVEIHRIPGGHFDMCRAPQVELLVRQLEICLAGSAGRQPGSGAGAAPAPGWSEPAESSLELPVMESGHG